MSRHIWGETFFLSSVVATTIILEKTKNLGTIIELL